MYKILIRPLEAKDSEISWKWRNDSEIWEFTENKPNIYITPEIEKKWIEKVLAETDTKRFAITVDDVYVGNIQLTNITSKDAEYHIFVGDKNYWGKGIAFSATHQIIRYAKNILKLENIYLNVNPQNLKGIILYEKCGFEKISDEVKMVLYLNEIIEPKVSIFCMVYNHEPFLRECLEGFFMQKCCFDYDIVIGEDCSTDNSRAIIKEYAQKYPGKLKLLLYETNIGAAQNQRNIFENCTGKYIAMCEGDDYWTDPLKLQKQVDFLETNAEYSLCAHNSIVIWENGVNSPEYFNKIFHSREIKIQEIINEWLFPTASLLIRREVILPLPTWVNNIYSGDMTLILLAANMGKLYFFKDISAVYRKSNTGVSHLTSKQVNFVITEHLKLFNYFNEFSSYKYDAYIKLKIKELNNKVKYNNLKKIFFLLPIIFYPKIAYDKIQNKLIRIIRSYVYARN